MKKIVQTIKLRKLKTEVNKKYVEEMNEGNYLILFKDDTCKQVYTKNELINILSKDHIKPIRYVFSMADRICIDRDVHINIEEVLNNGN